MLKKIIACVVAVAVAGVGIYFATARKSDEDMIVERFETFEKAYMSGDISACLECLSTNSRNYYKALGDLGGSVNAKAGAFNFNFGSDTLSALFALGVAKQDSPIKFKITKIQYTDETHAKVTAELLSGSDIEKGSSGDFGTVEMVKENGDWYMEDDSLLF